MWHTVRDVAVSADRFDEPGAAFEAEHPVTRGPVSAATARLFLLAAVEYAERRLPTHRPPTAGTGTVAVAITGHGRGTGSG